MGDIHGAFKALEQVMNLLDLQANDRLIFLGDYVDGWSESATVIEYLTALERQHHCIFIKGNHDIWCEEWLRGEKADDTWLLHGGQATVKSYKGLSRLQKERHLSFFERMPHYYVDDLNRLFVHAGFSSMHGPIREHFASNFSWDRTLWEMALAVDDRIGKGSDRYPQRLLLFSEIYIGHTPTTNYDVHEPMQACNVWNIDTGAAFNGRFTALNVETKEYWQSDVVQQLYPDEKGRNK
jgi:serine/threonine protein phosphatase 1